MKHDKGTTESKKRCVFPSAEATVLDITRYNDDFWSSYALNSSGYLRTEGVRREKKRGDISFLRPRKFKRFWHIIRCWSILRWHVYYRIGTEWLIMNSFTDVLISYSSLSRILLVTLGYSYSFEKSVDLSYLIPFRNASYSGTHWPSYLLYLFLFLLFWKWKTEVFFL